ncbi:hypothetical protein IFR05_017205, partial [Cadophora sp. M221]
MGRVLRSAIKRYPPAWKKDLKEYDTPAKQRFFDAFNRDSEVKKIEEIASDSGTSRTTAYRWLHERDEIGSPACRHKRKRSIKLGRKSRVTKEHVDQLLSHSNPVRNQLYEVQLQHFKIPVKPRALKTQLKHYTKNAQRFKQAYVKKEISNANKAKRVKYGKENREKTVESHWQYVHFTDEAHVDPSSTGAGYILREEGTREHPEDIQERPKKEGNKLHMAGWVNWHGKCEKLEFYHDEEEKVVQPPRPRKPRHRKYETPEQWEARMLEWEATKPQPVEVKPQGNSMTQKYYVERLLPVYAGALDSARQRDPSAPWVLQEDNDGSHGTRGSKDNLARAYKRDHNIRCI